MLSRLFFTVSMFGTQAQAADWPEANRAALHMACTDAIGPEVAPDEPSRAVFCVCFLREVQAAVEPESFLDQTPEAMAAMGSAMQTCKLEMLASAIQGGAGSSMFRMDEGDQATFRAACVDQRVSEGKTGDNQAHCACTIDYIAKR